MSHGVSDITIGPYRGRIAAAYNSPEFLSQLSSLSSLVAEAGGVSTARSRIVSLTVAAAGTPLELSVKVFNRQNLLKDLSDHMRGSKARRSWRVASAVHERGCGTPVPVGFLERWEGSRLQESYFLAVRCDGVTSFRDELIRLYTEDPQCWKVMKLLEHVAAAVRRLHDAGICHGDLGNQNILLERTGDAEWGEVLVVDLNRGHVGDSLSIRKRAFDVSRLSLPSDFLRVFKEMYWKEVPPAAFERWESCYRRSFAVHTMTRPLRHPLRALRERRSGRAAGADYPSAVDTWIWDERSGQPISPLKSKDRRRDHSLWRDGRLIGTTLASVGSVYRRYSWNRGAAYGREVVMSDRVGLALEVCSGDTDRRVELLEELGPLPVIIRFYHHEGEKQWRAAADAMKQLSRAGRSVSAALVQDRAAVRDSARWEGFVRDVSGEISDIVEWVEVGHAVNRAKWGVWNFDEYCRLVEGAAKAREAHPGVKMMGPAVIDFEYPVAVTALKLAGERLKFDALSHHLYVDRRGAPEGRQGGFDLVGKLALIRAIAEWAPGCEGGVIVSEANWPIAGTGVYSPVGSPYVSPGVRYNDPSVSEEDYSNYMIRYLLSAICSGMAERVYWWRLVARGFGLVDDTESEAWRRRPAFDALKHFVAAFGNAVFEKKVNSPGGTNLLVFHGAGGEKMAAGYSSVGPGRAELPFDAGRAITSRGEEVKCDGRVVELTGSPLYFFE